MDHFRIAIEIMHHNKALDLNLGCYHFHKAQVEQFDFAGRECPRERMVTSSTEIIQAV